MPIAPSKVEFKETGCFKRRIFNAAKKIRLIYGTDVIFFKKEGHIEAIQTKRIEKFLKESTKIRKILRKDPLYRREF